MNGVAGPGLANWRVYVDAAKDNRFDPGDTNTLTNASGNYTLSLKPGTYTIGIEIQNGFSIAAPSTFTFTVTVKVSPITGLKFVMKLCPPGL